MIKSRGLLQAFTLLVSSFVDVVYDFFSKIKTAKGDLAPLALSDQFKMYQPSRGRPLKAILNKLNLNTNLGIVDYGCGKGRALFVFQEVGFKKISGVDIIEEYIDIARSNVSSSVELIVEDFRNCKIKNTDHYFYFYDPCDITLLKNIFSKIKYSFEVCPREIVIIYHHNLLTDVSILNKELSQENTFLNSFGNQFFIWKFSP